MTVTALLVERCVCPACRAELTWSPTAAACDECGRRYAVHDGIPVLTTASENELGEDHKRSQASFFDDQPADWEITRPRGAPALYGWLMGEKFRRSLQGLETQLPGSTALTVCGGSGMDAEFLARAGATVIASDISLGAARRARERARRHGVAILPIVADAEALPFRDGSIDITYVHDGLHHLHDPLRGLREMARVASRALSLTEPARAAATALSVKLGISEDEEEAGNRVARLDPAQVVRALEASQMRVVGSERYAMYYRHEPGPVVRAFSRAPLLGIAKAAFRAGNLPLARVGNKLSVRAVSITEKPATLAQAVR